jgi:hypothetical protein
MWIREYGFTDVAILNAQLQSLLSLGDYAALTHDAAARLLADQLTSATRTLLPHFDTGCWARYSYDGAPASHDYQVYHVALVRKLAAKTGDAFWREVADRWRRSLGGRCA